ncbi:MAG: CPBP family intramembrane glutamic endopeptidase [Thermoguttaceae bacterium]|jgi:membrane protease YdiL (CAAX protease family)
MSNQRGVGVSENVDALIYNPTFIRSSRNYLLSFVRGKNFKTTVILLYAVFALSLWKYVPAAPRLADPETGKCVLTLGDQKLASPLDGSLKVSTGVYLWNARKIWVAFFIMGVFPALIVKFIFKESLADYGLYPKSIKRTLNSFLNFAPLFLILGWLSAQSKVFYSVYPYNPFAGVSWKALLLHAAMYLFLYYFAWEFMFRGFMQIGLADSLGSVPAAVMIQIIASTMLHYGHPFSETLGCIAGGLLWGYLVLRTKSLWSGWWQHALLGITLDVTVVLNVI